MVSEKLKKRLLPVKLALNKMRYLLNSRPSGYAFITGCPRSGTTALSDWIGLQRGVASMFESRILFMLSASFGELKRFRKLNNNIDWLSDELKVFYHRYHARHGAIGGKLIVEKEPLGPLALTNGKTNDFCDNILGLFPSMKVICMLRNPLSTIWSMTNRKWGHSLTNTTPTAVSIDDSIGVWNSNVDLLLHLMEDRKPYVCRFDEILKDPRGETGRVADFLNIRINHPFELKKTKEHRFDSRDKERILDLTSDRVNRLAEVGYTFDL